jgi:threonine/homoserine/homoserine lactone efflux protein
MDAATYLAFLSVSILVMVTPGPDTALTIRNTLVGGRKAGVFTAFGVAIGLAIWTLATSVGIVALIIASKPLFLAIKYAGAAFLIYLGVRSLLSAFGPERWREAALDISGPRLSASGGLVQGLASNLSNPKMVALFTSLLPQFATTGEGAFVSLIQLGLTFCALTFAWLVLYAFAVARAGDVLRRRNVQRVLEGITGGVLIALGLRVAAEQR